MRIRHRQATEDPQVQMAPLIDCVFLLLIFFLLATTLKKINRQLPIVLPYADAAVEVAETPDTLVLGVDKYGQLYVNSDPATTTMFFEQIRLAKARDMIVRLDADEDTRYKRILEVIEMCRIEGLNNVALHTRKQRKTP